MWITLTLSLIGRLGNAATYVIIYIYAAELFPTVVRSTAMGVCSITESFGGIIAPYIVDIHLVTSYHVGKALPLIIFGGSSILAGLLALLLPETSKKNLPDTIEEAKNFGR
ncbi:organic cation transporter protein-like [Physella acuta]|uniref:organic cation transporter protein-like n=1 Tax=Physella acuta TaxID=109671 RepID=UPI0027DAF18C|nr:organic cation transporter protein-like [Physella acuta]